MKQTFNGTSLDKIELQDYKFSMYDLYGIPYGILDGEQDGEGNITEKERDYDKARILIMQGKDLPEDLKQRLLQYKGESI